MSLELRAVITGDVVASTDLDEQGRIQLPSAIKRAYEEIRYQRERTLPYDVAVFSGDSWQIYAEDPSVGLLAAIYLRARLREELEVEVRSVLAIDTVDFVTQEAISESDGPAFRRSGRALSELSKDDHFQLVLPPTVEPDPALALASDGISDLVDLVARGWTPSQAQSVAQMLLRYPDEVRQQQIAEQWRPYAISQPAVNKHLRNGGWQWILRALDRYDRLVHILINR